MLKTSSINPGIKQIIFCLAVFAAAFMSFLIQPLIGKLATAKLGSAAAVWSVILMFFQLALLLGYLITFALSKLAMRMQISVYLGLLCLSLCFVRFPSLTEWQNIDAVNPTMGLLEVLTLSIGIPVTALYTVSGTVQNYCGMSGWRNPYILFSLSNLACLSSLLSYPFFLEPNFTLSSTCNGWVLGYQIAAVSTCIAALIMLISPVSSAQAQSQISKEPRSPAAEEQAGSASAEAPITLRQYLICIFFSAMGCVTLIAYTAYLTVDVAPVPLLWILPLCIYLMSFVICFKNSSYYKQTLFSFLAPMLWIMEPMFKWNSAINAALILLTTFSICMICSGELALRKPHHRDLTSFYLAIAFGGALGGIFENFVAPVIFDTNLELGLLGIFIMLNAWSIMLKHASEFKKTWVWSLSLTIMTLLSITLGCIFYFKWFHAPHTIAKFRDFYGCLRLVADTDSTTLVHGTTRHGSQSKDPRKLDEPTLYYARTTACGAIFPALRKARAGGSLNVGLVGMGAGTLACYGEPGDKFCFYEIDPTVEMIARKYFSFLSRSKAKISVLIGDGRKSLERQDRQNYDLLLIDAFSGDSVPTHLLTHEAFELYLKQLKPDAILMFHCSNRYVNLPAVITKIAQSYPLPTMQINSKEASYTIVYRQASMEPLIRACVKEANPKLEIIKSQPQESIGIWSDDYVNLPAALKLTN